MSRARYVKRFLRREKLPEMRFRDLRHTFATLPLAQDAAPRVVMEMLGHSQFSLTMKHVQPRDPGHAARGCRSS